MADYRRRVPLCDFLRRVLLRFLRPPRPHHPDAIDFCGVCPCIAASKAGFGVRNGLVGSPTLVGAKALFSTPPIPVLVLAGVFGINIDFCGICPVAAAYQAGTGVRNGFVRFPTLVGAKALFFKPVNPPELLKVFFSLLPAAKAACCIQLPAVEAFCAIVSGFTLRDTVFLNVLAALSAFVPIEPIGIEFFNCLAVSYAFEAAFLIPDVTLELLIME